MIIFNTENGICTHDKDSHFITQGYSGSRNTGLLNPSLQYKHNVGPICRGKYLIKAVDFTPLTDNSKLQLTVVQLTHLKDLRRLGPIIFELTPLPGTILHDPNNKDLDRGGFFIHWDTQDHTMGASDGCIIFYWEWVFEYIAKCVAAGDNFLVVI